jgi:hypothetical protein
MKLKIVLLALVGAAGATASFALAAPSHHGRGHENGKKDQPCSRAVVFGTAAPQSFTVTVTHAGWHSSFHTGDVVTVSVGGQGQDVAVSGFGCANGSTLQASAALLHVRFTENHGGTSETTTTEPTTTGDRGKGRHHHDPHGGTTSTTTGTTTSETTTAETTTSETTTSDTTTADTTTTSDTTTSDNNGGTTTSDTTTTSGGNL